MLRIMRYCGVLFCLFLLAGCFQVETVVKVNPDGSGIVEETILLSKQFIAQMQGMAQGMAADTGQAQTPPPPELFTPDSLKKMAAQMGEGVTYVRGEKLDNATFSGFKAVFAFRDINKLKLSEEPADLTAAGDAGGIAAPKSDFVQFRFTKGATSTIVLHNSSPKKSPAPAGTPESSPPETSGKAPAHAASAPPAPGTPPSGDDQAAEQLKKLFGGMKMRLVIEPQGKIVSTNATYRTGNQITIVDFDFDKLMASSAELSKFDQLQPGALGDARQVLKNVPGAKVDMNDTLTITFRGK